MRDDVVLFAILFAVSVSVIAIFMFYHIYRGVHDSLASASVGSVYNFRYAQPLTGDYERYLAKVVGIRKLEKHEISRLNWSSNYRSYDKIFQRSPTLVTCEMANGDFRQFYAERSDMCRRPAIAGLLFKMGVAHLF
jgi:hypothetical protein